MIETKNMLLSRLETQLVILESKTRELERAKAGAHETVRKLHEEHGMPRSVIPGIERLDKLT